MAVLPAGSARVGVPVLLCLSTANGASCGSVVTATPGHPSLSRIKLPLPFASTVPVLVPPIGGGVPSRMHSLAPFREMIVLKTLNVALTEALVPRGSPTTTTPPPAPVAKLSLMVAFSRVSEPFREKIAAPEPRHLATRRLAQYSATPRIPATHHSNLGCHPLRQPDHVRD